jgi:hypothetical protein
MNWLRFAGIVLLAACGMVVTFALLYLAWAFWAVLRIFRTLCKWEGGGHGHAPQSEGTDGYRPAPGDKPLTCGYQPTRRHTGPIVPPPPPSGYVWKRRKRA